MVCLSYFHGLVVKYLNRIVVRPKYAPLLQDLVVTAQIRYLIAFIVAVRVGLVAVVPFYSTIAVASHKVLSLDRLPCKSCRGVAAESRCISYLQQFPVKNIVNFGLAVGTPCRNHSLVDIHFESHHLGPQVPEKIDQLEAGAGMGRYYNLSGVILFVLLDCFLLVDIILYFF